MTVASNDIERLADYASQEMLTLSERMRMNKLSSKPQKTKFMVVGHPRKTEQSSLPNSVVLNNERIKK